MRIEEAQTEKLIKDKAKLLFFKKGLIKATMQDIANEAGVNRAMIHYYFRSREHMQEMLLMEALTEKRDRVRSVLLTDLPFREKIASYIDRIVDYGIEYPYLENFIISETIRNPLKVQEFCLGGTAKSSDLIREDLEQEISQGKLPQITPEHFLVNLLALCNYPLLAKPVLQTIHGMTDDAFVDFLKERKRIIFSTIFREDMPDITINQYIDSNTNHL